MRDTDWPDAWRLHMARRTRQSVEAERVAEARELAIIAALRLMKEVDACELSHGGLLTRDALRANHNLHAALRNLDRAQQAADTVLRPPVIEGEKSGG
jgi:hypothetical protein